MTASIGTSENIYTGLRELSQVTNTYGGYFISNGSAYNLQTPWQADKLEWYNYTTFATNSSNLQGVWFRDFPAGDALIVNRGTTTLTSTLEATNGVTIANTLGGFTNQHLIISGITTATPGVVTTSTNHNLSNFDRVVITKVIGTMAEEVNNMTFVVRVLSATTFGLYDTFGLPITLVGAYTSSGQVTKVSPLLGDVTQPVSPAVPQDSIIDYPVKYFLTLGTGVVGADNSVIYFVATKFNNYVNLGDTA